MATAELDVFESRLPAHLSTHDGENGRSARAQRRFHRIQEIRRREGMSLRSAARQLGCDTRTVRMQEQETTDLKISDLQRWQEALEVPIAELLVESDESLSGPVMERARMVRLMKTAAAIKERAGNTPISRLADMMLEQLVEIMPELKDVGPWHSVGQRRQPNEFGRTFERPFSLFPAGGSEGESDD